MFIGQLIFYKTYHNIWMIIRVKTIYPYFNTIYGVISSYDILYGVWYKYIVVVNFF